MRRRFLVVAGIVVLLAGAASAYYVTKHRFGGNVLGSSSGFVSTQTPKPPKPRSTLVSPMFGVDPQHLHVGVGRVRPPFHLDWKAGGRSLIEFPPALAFHNLYYATSSGNLTAISTDDAKRLWTVHVNRCEAAGPAVSASRGGTVYETFLNRTPCTQGVPDPSNGLVLAVSAGRKPTVRWKRNLGASETSPTVVGKRVYIGTATGDVYCLNADSGRTLWRYPVGAPVKGAIAYDRGKVFFGAYDGRVYALGAATGSRIWTSAGVYGHFYSTPAVAYSRVYIGSTNGGVYAFDERTGNTAWAQGTGSYVYGSPAVWDGRVYVGSYNHYFYALDAVTGDVDWKFPADGPISGSASVVDGVVYFAHLGRPGERHTYGLDARTGDEIWSWHDGSFSPVVSDRSKLYLVGWGKIYAFSPRSQHQRHRRHHHRRS
jgi:outer membrane protein assembly factor BamB